MGCCLSLTRFALFIFSFRIILCLASFSQTHIWSYYTSFSPVCPSFPLLFFQLPPSFLSSFLYSYFFSKTNLSDPSISFPCTVTFSSFLLLFLFILLHLWLFFLSIHRSVFLPPLGRNGKSDISYLVNGERWREKDMEEMKQRIEKWKTEIKRVTFEWLWRREEESRRGERRVAEVRKNYRQKCVCVWEREKLHLINLVMQSKYTV